MKLDLTDMFYALSFALDNIEAELLGLDTGHCRRVTFLSILMAKELGIKDEELRDFAGCCLLHDNALSEFIHEELITSKEISVPLSEIVESDEEFMFQHHSIIGERNIRLLPFRTDVKNIIRYHHETADGTGPMKRTAEQTDIRAQILHLADMVDMTGKLTTMTENKFKEMQERVQRYSGSMFSKESVDLFMKAVSFEDIVHLQDKDGVHTYFEQELTTTAYDYTDEEIHHIAELFEKIVDYKSPFTEAHSKGVADKAEIMARFYGFDPEKTLRFYFAGALHDIGKLVVSNNILEKPDRLTNDEFSTMKNHASATYYVLSQIKDIPDIVEWAANHHEKLNGKGYPRKLSEKELSFEDQLMACIDIYQALTEKRPYKDGFSHDKTLAIMRDMVGKGELNERIVNDIDTLFKHV